MIHTRDEVSSTQDFLIAGNSKIFKVFITILDFKDLYNNEKKIFISYPWGFITFVYIYKDL